MANGDAIAPSEEKMDLSSPPKPMRVTLIENTKTLQRTSSLPSLAGEVAFAQKNQALRLEKRIEFLRKLKDEHREVLRLTNEAEKHVQAVVRRSNFLQDDIDVCQKNCDRLRKDINIFVCNTEALKGDISADENDLVKEKRNYKVYEEKMTIYRELSEAAETYGAMNDRKTNKRSYEMLCNEKKDLEESNKIPRLLSGEIKEILVADIFTLEETMKELKENVQKKNQGAEEKEKQVKLIKEAQLLQKKNQAKLTWTRKQLQEIIARNKQWNEQTSQKETEIQETQRKIEES